MTITTLDKQTLRIVREKMNEALATLEEIGIHAKVGSISYEDQRASVKVEIAVMGENGEIVSKEASDYERYREMYELPELGTTFVNRGTVYTITGLKPRSTKYPVLAKRADGKSFKFTRATAAGRA